MQWFSVYGGNPMGHSNQGDASEFPADIRNVCVCFFVASFSNENTLHGSVPHLMTLCRNTFDVRDTQGPHTQCVRVVPQFANDVFQNNRIYRSYVFISWDHEYFACR